MLQNVLKGFLIFIVQLNVCKNSGICRNLVVMKNVKIEGNQRKKCPLNMINLMSIHIVHKLRQLPEKVVFHM